MALREFSSVKVGDELPTRTINLTRADLVNYAGVSGDLNPIHWDDEIAKQVGLDTAIAHGMLTLSLVTYLASQIVQIKQRSRGVNYGQNKVRFVSPVQCGARIRLHRTLEKYDEIEGGARLTYSNTVEIEGVAKPALVAETLTVVYK